MDGQPPRLPPSLLSAPPPKLLGSTEPRLWTRPLRELTPATSYGFAVIEFARDVLCQPLDPWQEWLVIHAGELLEDGRPRFRHVLVLVARQNGKTHLLKVLALYWLFIEEWRLILGTSTNLDYAKEAWEAAVETAEAVDELAAEIPRNGVRKANGEQVLKVVSGGRYKIGASNRKGGRSLSLDRLIQDELREHHDYTAWGAAVPAMNARPYAQNYCLSNQGDDRSIVLNDYRDAAIAFVDHGSGDPRKGIFEWSALPGAAVMDPDAWVAANPNLGRRIDVDTVRGDALTAMDKGGEIEATFRVEILCQRVKALDAAIDPHAWEEAKVPGDLEGLRQRALCIDVAPDMRHATIAAAAVLADGRVRVQIVEAWQGSDATRDLRKALPGWLTKIRPRAVGWLPGGPAAALGGEFTKRERGKIAAARSVRPQTGVDIAEIRSEVAAVCMGLAEQVQSGQILHAGEQLLDAHVLGAAKQWTGDQWRFARKGEGHCDAAYAAAGAVHLARTLPPSLGKPRLVTASS